MVQAIKAENIKTPAVNSTNPVTNTSMKAAANTAGDNKYILLQTAQAVALNEQNQKSAHFHILFDSGSQRIYITENLKNKPTR